MSEKEKEKKGYKGISRREFLKDAGLIAGGTVIGNTILLTACSGGETATETKTVTTTVGLEGGSKGGRYNSCQSITNN